MPLAQEGRKWLTFGSLIDAKLSVYTLLARELLKGGSERRVNDIVNRIIAINKQFPVSAEDFNRKYGSVAQIGKCIIRGSLRKRKPDLIYRMLLKLKRLKRSR